MNVYHNWGRWVVGCGSPVCVSAAQVQLGDESVVCRCRDVQICQHGTFCGVVTALVWPDDPQTIETVLSTRPLQNRHWYPHESVEDLEAENMAHGI